MDKRKYLSAERIPTLIYNFNFPLLINLYKYFLDVYHFWFPFHHHQINNSPNYLLSGLYVGDPMFERSVTFIPGFTL